MSCQNRVHHIHSIKCVMILFLVLVAVVFVLVFRTRRSFESCRNAAIHASSEHTVTFGVFHPYANGGGGGERVLYCALLALVFNEQLEVMEILWTFSIYLEAVAIIPQLILLQRHGEVENLTSNYVVLLGIYRGCYVLNWIYRAATELSYHFIWLMFIAGMVQTALYVDFFYYYAVRCVFL